jgi:hypothetical protein
MTSKDLIKAEVENVDEKRLDELYGVVRSFSRKVGGEKKPSLMSRLREIRIDAPEDFAENFDLYLSGEKRADSDPR